jgi:hypothetical protein
MLGLAVRDADSPRAPETQDMQRYLSMERRSRQTAGTVVVAELPAGGKGPADFPREVVTQCVEKALRKW